MRPHEVGHTDIFGGMPASGGRKPHDITSPLVSPKIRPFHLERRAIVYVRQSSPQQVLEHRESTARQYALVDRARALGWSPGQVEVIDEDQGRSGQTAEGRLGFQRLLAEVSLDHVGLVLGLEMSRLARSCKDWYQLLELCALFHTLLADQDGLYDPTDYNDRLLLGLKGTMSEAELHMLQMRMHEGRLNKARRGELFGQPPIGYVKLPTGEFALDPDEQVQDVVRLIFDEFERQGSLHGLLRYLVHHGIRLPVRVQSGPDRGRLEWRRPNRETLQNLLHNPTYAGTYRWGHRRIDPRRKLPGRPGTGRVTQHREPGLIVIENHLPAYITPERFRANQERLAANRARIDTLGAPRQGPSLLGGLLVCGRCGQRMRVDYGDGRGQLRYACTRATSDYGGPTCQGLAGRVLDQLVTQQVLAALEPAALELSLAAAEDLRRERDRLARQWQQRLERAHYQCQRAERQYQAVEPENRLVGRELERRWEQALAELQQVEAEYDRFQRAQPAAVTAQERAQVLALAENIPALWRAPTTTAMDRQRVIRCLVERVVATVDKATNRVAVTITWAGGQVSGHEVIRPVSRYEQLADYGRLVSRIEELRDNGLSVAEVAERLNAESFSPPKRASGFTGPMVARLLRQRRGRLGPRPRTMNVGVLRPHEWWLSDLAERLRVPTATLLGWVRRGWIHGRKVGEVAGGRWAVWADEDELERLSRLHRCPRSWDQKPLHAELIIPKDQPRS
jgi:DNA invertase Pin-like site-specific DNA recombinase